MLSQSLARLSSGSKVVSPADDSAGLAVSVQLVSQIGRDTAASNNVADANSYNQTQDGYLQQVSSALNRLSELAIQAQDVTKSDGDRSLYNQEFTTLSNFIKDLATKDFNGVSLFNGTALSVTTDADGNMFTMNAVNLNSATYAALATDGVGTIPNAQQALTDVKTAIAQVAADRAALGANEERLSMYTNTLATLSNNLSAANSVIMDVDVAKESTQYAKYNILVQTGTAMLAQANAVPQIALKLLA